jgi:peptidoglycan/LPS O-acetylase OafA/YrhL
VTRRADIDGLRAVAVVAVLLYHLGAPGARGGFVGVDVFFVISGYLITKMIAGDLDRGTFGFGAFYARRARRLLPAMFVVIALTLGASFFVLGPEPMASLGRSAVAATLGGSNVLFWIESDYFDLAARQKPLLHTWSLGVEWQFYAVWPVVLAVTRAALPKHARAVPIVIGALGIASVAVDVAIARGVLTLPQGVDGATTVFYHMPFRVFELALGALIVWTPAPRTEAQRELSAALGLAMIGAAVVTFDGRGFFPAANALLPTVGAALVLWGGEARVVGAALRSRTASYLGRISYSVYLVHWPLLVLTEYALFRPLRPVEAAGLGALSIALGAAMHHAVELPFHERKVLTRAPRLTLPALGVLAAALLVGVSARAAATGWPWRLDADALALDPREDRTGVAKDTLGRLDCRGPCEFGDKKSADEILVVGDSHVEHYTKALRDLAGDRYHFFLAYGPSCFFGATMTTQSPLDRVNRQCAASNATLREWLAQHQFRAIVLSELWSGYREALVDTKTGAPLRFASEDELYARMLDDATALYAGFTGKIVVLGRAPSTNTACYRRPRYLPLRCPDPPLDEHATFARAFSRFAASSKLDLSFVDPVDDICPRGRCRVVDDGGRVLYTDVHHLSRFGAALVVPRVMSLVEGQAAAP